MSNPFSGDTTTTGARAGNDTYNNLTNEAQDEVNAISEISGTIGGRVISKISATASESGGTNVEEDFVPPPSAAPPDFQKIQQKKFDDIKTTVVAIDDHLERTYVDVINAKKAEIVTLSGQLYAAATVSYPSAGQRLITTTTSAPGDSAYAAVNPTGISTFVYPDGCDPDPLTCTTDADCCLIGVRGSVFPDIIAASHFPNLSNGNHSQGTVPAAEFQRTFVRVSRTITGSGNYASNTLGIGQTLYASGDDNYRGAESVVTSQTALGTYYFFSNASNINAGMASSITSIMGEITVLRNELNSKITTNVNELREQKHQEELNTWFMDAGFRTNPVKDYGSSLDALRDTEISNVIKSYDG